MIDDEGGSIKLMLFDVETRRLFPNRKLVGNIALADVQCELDSDGKPTDKIGYVLGWYDQPELLWVNYDAEVVPLTQGKPPKVAAVVKPEAPVVPVSYVKDEAARRIEAVLPMWMVARAMTGGKPIADEASAQAEAIRKASNKIEAMKPIPFDFDNDKYWP